MEGDPSDCGRSKRSPPHAINSGQRSLVMAPGRDCLEDPSRRGLHALTGPGPVAFRDRSGWGVAAPQNPSREGVLLQPLHRSIFPSGYHLDTQNTSLPRERSPSPGRNHRMPCTSGEPAEGNHCGSDRSPSIRIPEPFLPYPANPELCVISQMSVPIVPIWGHGLAGW